MTETRATCTVLGRIIGTHTGWDQVDDWTISLDDFEPAPGIDLPKGILNVAFEEGWLEVVDNQGKVLKSIDVIDALRSIPRGGAQ